MFDNDTQKSVEIKKAQNGYIVTTREHGASRDFFVNGMMKLMESTGAVESWQEDKLTEIEEVLKKMPQPPAMPVEKTHVFKTLNEAVNFMYDYFGEIKI